MSSETYDWGDYAGWMAGAVEIDLPDAIRPLVVEQLAILAQHAERVMGEPLDDEVEPAPVFRP